MSLVTTLLILGAVLICIEVFLPGGIVGAIGGACMLAGVIVSYYEYGHLGAMITLLISLAVVAVFLFLEFKILPNTKLGKKFFLQATVEGTATTAEGKESFVGEKATALTALAPTGYVLVSGKKMEASSKSGFISKDEKLVVTDYDNFKLTVIKE